MQKYLLSFHQSPTRQTEQERYCHGQRTLTPRMNWGWFLVTGNLVRWKYISTFRPVVLAKPTVNLTEEFSQSYSTAELFCISFIMCNDISLQDSYSGETVQIRLAPELESNKIKLHHVCHKLQTAKKDHVSAETVT